MSETQNLVVIYNCTKDTGCQPCHSLKNSLGSKSQKKLTSTPVVEKYKVTVSLVILRNASLDITENFLVCCIGIS